MIVILCSRANLLLIFVAGSCERDMSEISSVNSVICLPMNRTQSMSSYSVHHSDRVFSAWKPVKQMLYFSTLLGIFLASAKFQSCISSSHRTFGLPLQSLVKRHSLSETKEISLHTSRKVFFGKMSNP
jgi:hypothetical protein